QEYFSAHLAEFNGCDALYAARGANHTKERRVDGSVRRVEDACAGAATHRLMGELEADAQGTRWAREARRRPITPVSERSQPAMPTTDQMPRLWKSIWMLPR